jgi:2-desacetyl-2-hydroxyethyl bacteriochlorophyllide A dehydrogenase
MKAVVFVKEGQMALEDRPLPELKPGHILCKTLLSGVTNGTERNSLMGGNYGGTYPAQPGYQNVARVVAVGESVSTYQIGDVVFSGGHHKHVGYFAPDVSQPEHPDNLIQKLPEDLDLRWACMFGMAAVAMHDVRRSEVSLGEKALVVGAGSVGLFTSQIARAAGANATICDLDPARLDIAKSVGIVHTVRIENDETWQQIKASGPYDVVFEDSGAPILDKIVGHTWGQGLITKRGRIIVIAGRADVTYNFNAGQSHEATLFHASHFDRSDLKEICRLVTECIVHVEPLIKDEVPITDAPSIYERLRDL